MTKSELRSMIRKMLREELSLLEAVSIKDIKIGDRISYCLDVAPEERWEDALVVDISSNTITVLDPYGAFGETAKLDFSNLLNVEVTSGVWYDLKKLETDDYQNRNGDYPRSGRPDTINVSSSYISFSFKNTPQSTAERWVEKYLNSEGFSIAKDAINSYQSGDYFDDWVDVDIQIYKISNNKAVLTESTQNNIFDFLAIDGFEYSIEDTFEDEGYTGYEVIYSKDGCDIVKVELWEDGNYVTVIENLYAQNLMQRNYETFTQFAEDLIYKCDRYLHEEVALIESSLTAEEKVDAWHNGTRRENYKAAGIPKLQTFLDIAKRKGYTEIVDIIETELIKRGVTPAVSTPTASTPPVTTNPVSTSVASTSEVEPDIEVSTTDIVQPPEPPHFSDELVKELETPVLSDEEKDILIGKAIDYLGKVAFYARSHWRTAMGFIGSYSTTWYNSNGNEVKSDRAKDRVRDLTYTSDRLIVLRSHFDGGSHNIDRYYSIEIPSSTKYILDKDKIRKMIYSSYYDSEIDWKISTLAKTTTNRKKFKQYLIDTAGMPIDQAEELTIYAFDKRVW